MRTWVLCSQCASENPRTDAKVYVELNNQLLFDSTCERGHRLLSTLETTRFTLLFDFGIAALLDGYYREAVTSFAASLERLYEFTIRVICRKNSVPLDSIETGWTRIASSSERQFGAFSMLYLQETRSPPGILPKKCGELRNNVIHKGYIPSKEETVCYAKAVHDHMLKIIKFVSQDLQSYSDEVWIDERARRASGRTDLQSTSHGNANFISRTHDDLRSNFTFEEKLAVFSRGSRWIVT